MIIGFREMMWAHIFMGHDEQALRLAQQMPTFREMDQPYGQQGLGLRAIQLEGAFARDMALGDFAQAAAEGGCLRCPLPHQLTFRAEALARAHDARTSRTLTARSMAEPPSPPNRVNPRGVYMSRARTFQDATAGDWPAAIAGAHAYEAEVKADETLSPRGEALVRQIQVAPLLAYALARSGDMAGARAVIEATPADCYDCVRTRGLVAAAAGQWDAADRWFVRAVHDGPSIPFAYTDWGQSLLARGQPDAAIAKFAIAHQKGPRFADPLEGWGEALMAKNQSHLALPKFAAANQYAPNWGRLHLKWGEALVYAGKKDEARKQFTRAAQLDLTPAEKAELARHL
jgi:tetratricopeptide (TPR) repeat protein